jgi:hypothetical protein
MVQVEKRKAILQRASMPICGIALSQNRRLLGPLPLIRIRFEPKEHRLEYAGAPREKIYSRTIASVLPLNSSRLT